MKKITHEEIVAQLTFDAEFNDGLLARHLTIRPRQKDTKVVKDSVAHLRRCAAIYREAIRRLEAFQAWGIKTCREAVTMLQHEQGGWLKKRAARRRGRGK